MSLADQVQRALKSKGLYEMSPSEKDRRVREALVSLRKIEVKHADAAKEVLRPSEEVRK